MSATAQGQEVALFEVKHTHLLSSTCLRFLWFLSQTFIYVPFQVLLFTPVCTTIQLLSPFFYLHLTCRDFTKPHESLTHLKNDFQLLSCKSFKFTPQCEHILSQLFIHPQQWDFFLHRYRETAVSVFSFSSYFWPMCRKETSHNPEPNHLSWQHCKCITQSNAQLKLRG